MTQKGSYVRRAQNIHGVNVGRLQALVNELARRNGRKLVDRVE